jgi:AraC-like DNA-binding protein
MNIFSEFLPATELMPYVQTYWQGNFNVHGEDSFSQIVLPNGCIELIIHMTDDHCLLSKPKEGWSTSPEFTLLGLFENPYTVQFHRQVKVFGIRFYPDGIRNIFGVPPSEFIETYEAGFSVLGKQLQDFCATLRERENVDQQIQCANRFITARLSTNKRVYDYTHLTMRLIRGSQGMTGYQELIQQVPISPRQLQREFKNVYGITVKDYIRLSRLNAINRYMLSKNVNLSQLPYELNFTDQSHFIKEFKTFAGVAPTKFMRRRGQFIVNPGNGKD